MDNHPIPQDVTGFQFKLIGNMTVKQFAYLATGVVFAWILWQLPINFLVKFPVCAFFALLGTGLAYFPISGRPMDLMIGNYIKALFRPTQFVYEKTGGQIYFPHRAQFATLKSAKQYKNDFSPFPKDKLKAYLESLDTKPKNKIDAIEDNFLMSVSGLSSGNTTYQPPTPGLNIQSVSPSPTKIAAAQEPTIITRSDQPVEPLVKQEISQPAPIVENAIKAEPATPKPTKPLVSILKGSGKTFSLPSIPDSPSLITGIARDARGNALSNILVEVKDKDGNPVRAFKTNEVGRFASATPLTNGTYAIEFEDPKAQNKFEKITINVTGQIIMPIEAVSIDTREELRRSLFNAN